MKAEYCYRYPRPALSVDCAIFKGGDVLLIQRGGEPFVGCWALPGGFLELGEDLADGAARELEEETGLRGIELSQVGAFGAPDRDPREHVVSVAFFGEAAPSAQPVAGDDASGARWFPLRELPQLAFDHPTILEAALAMR